MERRKAHRAPVVLPARYMANNPTPLKNHKAVTRDIGPNGAALVFEHRMDPKAIVEVELEIPDFEGPLKTKGEVVWQREIPWAIAPTFLTGVRFLEIHPALTARIERFVAGHLKGYSQFADEQAVKSFERVQQTARPSWPIPMATFRTTCALVAATGCHLPTTKLSNQALIEKSGADLQAILLQRALGAVERRAASPDETGADLMACAGRAILESAGCDPKDLDRIICSLDPGDAAAPCAAVHVQTKLGATCPAYDVTMSCAGWICAVEQGLRALALGERRILVLAGSTAGSKVPFRDVKHRAIFGDGAGGILLERSHKEKPLATALWADGRFYSRIFSPYPWSVHPRDIPQEYKGHFYMDPNQNIFFDQLTRVLPPFFQRLLKAAEVTVDQIDHFLLHQPSGPLFEHSLKLLKAIPRAKVFDSFATYGNLVAAEMPVMLDEGIRSGRIKRGDIVCMVTYGAGFTMAGLIMHY
jgi:3-oxoacyl-[acyl-carrier-protein] synthase-3